MTVVGGQTGRFGVLAENTGNTTVSAAAGRPRRRGEDLRSPFVPPVLTLAPGDQAIGRPAGPRPAAMVRLPGGAAVRHRGAAGRAAGRRRRADRTGRASRAAGHRHPGAEAAARPGLLSLLSLLLAVTVFAIVITIALSQLVGVSAADRDLAIQVAAAQQNTGGAGAGSDDLGGTVVLLTNGAPVAGVTVELFATGVVDHPDHQTATGRRRRVQFGELPSGAYKLRFRGAGFAEIWYPAALTGEDATGDHRAAGEADHRSARPARRAAGLGVRAGGRRRRRRRGAHRAGAGRACCRCAQRTGRLEAARPTDHRRTGRLAAPPPLRRTPPGAVLMTVPIGSDGTFEVTDLPSPRITSWSSPSPGSPPTPRRIDLVGGESRTGVQLRLRTGDGLISGTVTGPDGPLGDAVVTATTGTTTVSTVSLTERQRWGVHPAGPGHPGHLHGHRHRRPGSPPRPRR